MAVRVLDVEASASVRAAVVGLWQECGLTRPWNPPERDLDDALRGATSAVLAILDDDTILDDDAADASDDDAAAPIATVLAGFDGHRGWLYYLAVHPDHRGRGLARELVTAAEHWLAAQGARKVQLMVRPGNPAAGLYPGLGYERQDVEVYGRWLTEDH